MIIEPRAQANSGHPYIGIAARHQIPVFTKNFKYFEREKDEEG